MAEPGKIASAPAPKKSSSSTDLTSLIEEALGGLGGTSSTSKYPQDPTGRFVNIGGVGGRTVKANPIGVQPGYTAPYTGQRMSPEEQAGAALGDDPTYNGVAARYDDTDLDLFAGLSPEAVSGIQSSLMRAGLIDKVPKGVWDPTTAGAMSKVLAFANQRGLLWQDALDLWAEAGAAAGLGGGSGARGPVFTPRLSNPDDLRKVFKQAAFNTLGGNFLDDAAYERMVAGYQDAELRAQRAEFDAAVGGGGTTVEAPTAQTFGEDQIKAENKPQSEAHGIMQYGRVLESLLGGG